MTTRARGDWRKKKEKRISPPPAIAIAKTGKKRRGPVFNKKERNLN